MRRGNLKIKKAGGGLGGRAQRLPPNAFSGGLTFVGHTRVSTSPGDSSCCCCCC